MLLALPPFERLNSILGRHSWKRYYASKFLDPTPVLIAFQKVDDETLLLARSELLQVAPLLARVLEMAPGLEGLGPLLAVEMRADPEWPWPVFLLYWLRYREDPKVRRVVNELQRQLNLLNQLPEVPAHVEVPRE